jgi:hypothetical protein
VITNPVDDYALEVIAGRVPAGKYHRLACVRHMSDRSRESTAAFPYRFDWLKANQFVKFCALLKHYKGEFAGQPIVLQPYQMIKDHRTKMEIGDVTRVLDGDLDGLIKTYLMQKASGTLGVADAIETAPVSLPGAIAEGFETGVRSVADTLTGAWAWVADRASELGITPTPANATRLFARLNAYSPEETNAMVRNLEARGLSWRDLVSAGAKAVRERPSAVEAQAQRPITSTVGNVAGQIATTAPVIGALATRGAAATAANLPVISNFLRSVSSSGIGTRTIARGTPAAANAMAAGVPVASSTAGNIGLRFAGGGTAGATATAMTGASGTSIGCTRSNSFCCSKTVP